MSEKETRITDVAPTLYIHNESQRPLESIEQIQEDLWTWWAEADLRPSPIKLLVKNNRLEDKYGNDLVLQAKAGAIIRKGSVEKNRVDAETLGVERLRDLLLSSESKDGVVYISPPGAQEEGFGAENRRRLSFTYLYHVGNAGRIHFLAIPELELSVNDHLLKINDQIDRDKTKEIVGEELGGIDNRKVVAYPFIANSENALDLLAKKFGYENLIDLWRIALEAKRLRGRVGDLIKHSSKRIWDACQNMDNERLEVLGDVFRGVVALLVAEDLKDIDNVNEYFDSKVHAIVESKKIDRLGGAAQAAYAIHAPEINEFIVRVRQNRLATDIVQGGSCPGKKGLGLGDDLFGLRFDSFTSNHVMMDVLSEDPFEAMSQDESYSFDRVGKCVVCKVDPTEIGPCGICRGCDAKIRSQAD